MDNCRKDFESFARSMGVSSTSLDKYERAVGPVNGIVEPYILEERTLNVASMSVFSRLFYDRIVFLISEVTAESADIVKAQLLYLNSTSDEDIKLFINSPGGSVIDGLAIYDVMNFVTPDVSTYCFGMAASMGSVLLSSGTKGKRYALPHSYVMIHQVSSHASGQVADMKISYEQALKSQNMLYQILSENTGKTFEEISRDADRDKWFIGEEAVEYGLVDQLTSVKK